jgi:hypothetical protein
LAADDRLTACADDGGAGQAPNGKSLFAAAEGRRTLAMPPGKYRLPAAADRRAEGCRVAPLGTVTPLTEPPVSTFSMALAPTVTPMVCPPVAVSSAPPLPMTVLVAPPPTTPCTPFPIVVSIAWALD